MLINNKTIINLQHFNKGLKNMGDDIVQGQGTISDGPQEGDKPKEENIFRPEYRELQDDEKILMQNIKETAHKLITMYPQAHGGRFENRELALAGTKLEESIMWAVKGITK